MGPNRFWRWLLNNLVDIIYIPLQNPRSVQYESPAPLHLGKNFASLSSRAEAMAIGTLSFLFQVEYDEYRISWFWRAVGISALDVYRNGDKLRRLDRRGRTWSWISVPRNYRGGTVLWLFSNKSTWCQVGNYRPASAVEDGGKVWEFNASGTNMQRYLSGNLHT